MNSRIAVCSLTAALISLGAAEVRADPAAGKGATIRVGVVPGIAVNLDAAKVDALSQDLAESLTAELDVQAIGGLDVRRALPPDGVAADCITVPACVADVAKRLDVQQLLFVVMVDTGGSIQVDTTWVEPASGHSAARPAIDLATIGNARARFATIAHQLLPDAAVREKTNGNGNGNGGGGGSAQIKSVAGTPRHITTPALITGGIAIVGLGVAVGFGLDTRSNYNSCESKVCDQSQRDSIRHTGIAADAGLVIGIAAAITGAILYSSSSESPQFIVAPIASGVALATGWRF